MPLAVACPSCAARVTAPDRLAGKAVKCPKCQSTFTLLMPDPGYEVIEDDEPVVAKPKVKPPEPPVGFSIVEDDEPERPKPKKLPRKRIVEEDEDERYPIPRRRSPGGSAASHTRLFITLGGGVIFLAVIAVGLYYALGQVKVGTPPTAAPTTPTPEVLKPVEWKTFTTPDKAISVSLPGTPTASADAGDLAGAKTQTWELKAGDWEYKFTAVVLPPELPAESILETMVEALTAGVKKDAGVTRTDVALGKHPARQVRFVNGSEHLYLRAAAVGNKVFVFMATSKVPSTETADEVKKYFDSVTIQ
jgi:hypothetical protein